MPAVCGREPGAKGQETIVKEGSLFLQGAFSAKKKKKKKKKKRIIKETVERGVWPSKTR